MHGLFLFDFHFVNSVPLGKFHSLIIFAADDRSTASINNYIDRTKGKVQFDCMSTELCKDGAKPNNRKRKINEIN